MDAMAAADRVGAAKRRRDRQLRAFRRHELLTVRMELGGPLTTALTGWRGRERERSTKNTTAYGHRSDLSRGCGRVSRRSLSRRFGLPGMTLAMPSRAGAAGEVVDAGTLAFLTQQAVEDKRKAKQAKEKAGAEKLEDEWVAEQLEQRLPGDWAPYFWHRSSGRSRWTLPTGASCGGVKRKKKKTKRRRRRRARWCRSVWSAALHDVSYDSLFSLMGGFYGPLYLAATCSVLVCPRSACVDSSGRRLLDLLLYSALLGSTVVTCLRQFTEAAWFSRIFCVKVDLGSLS